ncbi:MAG: hypothetical protein ABFC24_07450 [Methanoregulaceae archaeon]
MCCKISKAIRPERREELARVLRRILMDSSYFSGLITLEISKSDWLSSKEDEKNSSEFFEIVRAARPKRREEGEAFFEEKGRVAGRRTLFLSSFLSYVPQNSPAISRLTGIPVFVQIEENDSLILKGVLLKEGLSDIRTRIHHTEFYISFTSAYQKII